MKRCIHVVILLFLFNLSLHSESHVRDDSDLAIGIDPHIERSVRLAVPLVRQTRGPLCGPASIEMLFRYWGENRHTQYDIARALVWQFREENRYRRSETLLQIEKGIDAGRMDWSAYPGTGTYYMREFLTSYAPTRNPRVQQLPDSPSEALVIRNRFFSQLKGHLDSDVPVIVHQWFNEKKSTQHYRVVTGYDDRIEKVYMNDPKLGRIEMSYELFLKLWLVEEDWLPYNFIVFNVYSSAQIRKGRLRIDRWKD